MTNDANFFDEIVLVEFLGQSSGKGAQKYTRLVAHILNIACSFAPSTHFICGWFLRTVGLHYCLV